MKKTYITPAAEAIGMNAGSPILGASDGTLPVENGSNVVDDPDDAWTRPKSGWSCSNWSDTGYYD